MQRVLERFQDAEKALRKGSQAVAAEASETAAAEGWNRVGSATSTQALNLFATRIGAFIVARDVPDTGASPQRAHAGPEPTQQAQTHRLAWTAAVPLARPCRRAALVLRAAPAVPEEETT